MEGGALRAQAMLHANSAPTPPAEYATIPIETIAAGHSRATYATVVGDVTQVTHELDGDYHIRVEGQGAFLVLEIMPEFPLVPPHIGQEITAWGVVRHDGLHNWWELHPLVGWQPGNVAGPPATGSGSKRLIKRCFNAVSVLDGSWMASPAPRRAPASSNMTACS